ncbi:MAG: hypothetical protein KME27_24255 [Lyngbya sp. HA4199-MV5]|jgi:hypothetical protein|nr:hypothetical protein [Lyngbya sp. HA4199-MV5]
MRQKFEFEFEDQSSGNEITFDHGNSLDEEFNITIENNVAVMYGNRQAFLSLAKLFLKIALCNYPIGFHLHLKKDFDADEAEVFRICLSK